MEKVSRLILEGSYFDFDLGFESAVYARTVPVAGDSVASKGERFITAPSVVFDEGVLVDSVFIEVF
jgi:hypothetical protein